MKKKLIIILAILGFIGGAYLIASLALSNLLSAERLRVMLVEPIENQLGRKVEIGAIKVSLFSGIEINDIIVKEKNPARDFISIATFRLNYELLPLLHKRLVIKEVLIDQPTVRITRDAQGVFNFADLSLKPRQVKKEIPPPELQTVEPLPLTLVFDQIRVNDLNLAFSDQTGELPAIASTDGDLALSVSLGKTLAEARYHGTLELVVNAAFQKSKPVMLLKSEFSEQLITFKGELNVELDRLFFNGQLANHMTAPDLTLNLQGASLDLVKLGGLKPAGQRKAAPAAPSQPPAAPQPAPRKVRVHGEIGINELRRDKLAVKDLKLAYNYADNVLDLSALSARIFEGAVNGKGRLDLGRPTPAFRAEIKADRLQMAAAMAAMGKPKGDLTGELSAEFSGNGTGTGWPVFRNNLEGQGKFTVVKGGVASSPLSQALASLLAIPELNNLQFDKLFGTVRIANGTAALEANLASRPLLIEAKGNFGLDGSLDLPLVVQLSPEYSQRLQARASFARYLADASGRTTLYLKLKGTVDQPSLSLNGGGAGSQVKRVLEKKAGEELSRALSKKLGGLDSRSQEAAQGAAGQLLDKLLGN